MNLFDPWNACFLVAFLAYVGIRHTFEKRSADRQTTERRVDGAERGLLGLVLVTSLLLPLLYLFTPLLDFADYALSPVVRTVGVFLLVIALLLFWRSHADLGGNWSRTLELRSDHALVTGGVYRRVRHPMYTAIFLFDVGQGLILANWLAGWSALVAFTALYAIRVPKEEAMLRSAFREEYERYARTTGRLWPRFVGRRDAREEG